METCKWCGKKDYSAENEGICSECRIEYKQ